MKKFARTLMVTLTALCLSVCFLFAGCSKHAGTYTGTTSALTGGKSVVLKLKNNEEFEMKVGDTTKEGTWKLDEEDETKIIFMLNGNELGIATFDEENKTVTIGTIIDSTLAAASLTVLTKK